jgi:hypothetical protein
MRLSLSAAKLRICRSQFAYVPKGAIRRDELSSKEKMFAEPSAFRIDFPAALYNPTEGIHG